MQKKVHSNTPFDILQLHTKSVNACYKPCGGRRRVYIPALYLPAHEGEPGEDVAQCVAVKQHVRADGKWKVLSDNGQKKHSVTRCSVSKCKPNLIGKLTK